MGEIFLKTHLIRDCYLIYKELLLNKKKTIQLKNELKTLTDASTKKIYR